MSKFIRDGLLDGEAGLLSSRMFLRFSNVEQLGACGASMSVLNIILYNGVDNMFEYVDENPVLRVTIYNKTTTYLNCTIIYWYKVVFLPGII